MDFKLNGVYMSIFNKILCILAALAIYPATVTTPKSSSFELKPFVEPEPIANIAKPIHIRKYEPYTERVKQLSCLQKNIYFEAAVESTAGKLAVAHVTYNRVKNKKFPSTFCEVIYEGRHHASGHPKRNQCQFSWYCDGKHDVPYPGPTWKQTQEIAEWFYDHKDNLRDITDGALYYHADYIDPPKWTREIAKTVQIDTHMFYRKL